MRMKPYPDFQKSDNDWVPSLPSHWKSTQLRHVARIYAGGTPDRTNLEFWRDGTVPWLNSGSVNDWNITSPSEWITEEAASGGKTRWVPPKSVLIALAGQGKTKGMVARLEIDSTCNQSMAAVVPTKDLEYRFAQFWISANYQNVRNLAGGDLRDGLNLQHIGSIHVPIPPIHEQLSISNFLDNETAEIDAFIADQEELIELLSERRTATITRAVTKGLDPNSLLKDSGVEWLGKVPEHWTITSLKHYIDVLPGYAFKSKDFTDDEKDIRLLRGININPGRIRWDDVVRFNYSQRTDLHDYELQAGDLVLGLDRPIVSEGIRVASIKDDDLPSLVLQRVARIRTVPDASQTFVKYLLESEIFANYLAPLFTGVSVPHMSPGQLGSFTVAMSHPAEQQEITAYLNRETAEIDAAIADAREAIVLSKERRAAVISAAVTGKIDVRGFVVATADQVEGASVGAA